MTGDQKGWLRSKEQQEINFWRDSAQENPDAFKRGNFLNKTRECMQFDYKVMRFKQLFRKSKFILELGAGQGWASCYVKRFFNPGAHFTVTDISPYAIESLPYWENVFDVKVDNKLACTSYEVPLRDESFDLIFCYAAAHHFVRIKETLEEIHRLLKPGGKAVFLYEPTSSRLFYRLHKWYVNRDSRSAPEDVLIPAEMEKYAKASGLGYTHRYDARQRLLRAIPVGIYFRILQTLPFLQYLLPSSSDFVFIKNKRRN